MVQKTVAKKKIINEVSGTVFSLPWYVARDEGLFAAEGLDVEFVKAGGLRQKFDKPVSDPNLVESIGAHQVFEDGKVQLYRACEWGQVRRAHDSGTGGLIIGKRAAVGVMGIFSRKDSPIVHPQDLRNKTVGVAFHAGSHYASIQMLEGFLEDHEIKVVHIGGNRYEALLNGVVDAAAFMEPLITLAEKNGMQKIIETHYVGSEIAGAGLDAETFEALNRAIRKAVALINADKRKYVHYMIDDLEPKYRSQITPADFHLPRLRYVDPAPYAQGEFESTVAWMKKWKLIPEDASFDQIVDNRIAAA